MSTYATPVDLKADVIDVRDIIARVEHLEKLRQPGPVDMDEDSDTPQDELFSELATLEAILEDLKGEGGDEDWRGDWYPVTLVRDGYFKRYAQQMAEDIGSVVRNAPWPNNFIDWEAAADALQTDYSSVDIGGEDYWFR